MSNQLPKKLAPYFPWLGLLCLIAGIGVYYVTRQFDLLTNLTLALGVLFLLLYALINPDEVRELMSGRQAQYGTSTLLSILFFTAIIVAAYIIAFQNNDWRFDATETNEFTPLPETIALLEDLEEPIHVIGFFTIQTTFQQEDARTRLEALQAFTDQITYEFVDPEENPVAAQQYDLTFNSTLVFTQGDDFSKAAAPLSDRSLHTALVQVLNPVEKKAYFITGHGERDSEDFGAEGLGTAVSLLEESGFEVDTLPLFTVSEIPDDATVLVMIDQQSPLTDEEFALIESFLDNGGAAFIARDALDTELRAQLEDGEELVRDYLATDWGLTLRPDVVIDSTFSQAGQEFGLAFLGANYGNSPITSNDLDRFGTVFSIARSIGMDDTVEGIARNSLVLTSQDAWGETDFVNLAQGFAEPNPEVDAVGTLPLAVSAENMETNGRIVLIGDTDLFSNNLILQNGNGLFFSNAMNWLADDELAVNLTPRETVNRQVTISQSQLLLVTLTIVCLGPLLAMIAGIAVWYSRRQRR